MNTDNTDSLLPSPRIRVSAVDFSSASSVPLRFKGLGSDHPITCDDGDPPIPINIPR